MAVGTATVGLTGAAIVGTGRTLGVGEGRGGAAEGVAVADPTVGVAVARAAPAAGVGVPAASGAAVEGDSVL